MTPESFNQGLQTLTSQDAVLAGIVERFGPPPFWQRPPGFATLVLIILEQQVSLASARAVFERLARLVTPFTAVRLLEVDDSVLKSAGLTRQKLAYCRYLSQAIVSNQLRLETLETMSDHDARRTLIAIKGIGPWTADIYLLMALKRPDIWPAGDLALVNAVKELDLFAQVRSKQELETASSVWQPWRAIAARILWHHYLSVRKRSAPELAPIA
jgi:DNA-3-methyladenine glycosylase II